ncbi:MAG: acyl carrier protein [Clostridiales bacterium]|jgi:acyl carrier protein|nr:acyl carrier protein [Clostridiales bacterium]
MVLEKVTTFISEQLNIDEDSITEDTLFEELGADELDIAELVMAVEGEFEIELSEDEVNSLFKVSDLTQIVETAISLR